MNMDKKNEISEINSVRYTPPSRFDQAPFGKVVYVAQDDDKTTDVYIQLNTDETNANWQKIGVFFEVIFNDLIKDQDFIQECLKLFSSDSKNFTTLADILKK
jgi:hypothetical protein